MGEGFAILCNYLQNSKNILFQSQLLLIKVSELNKFYCSKSCLFFGKLTKIKISQTEDGADVKSLVCIND